MLAVSRSSGSRSVRHLAKPAITKEMHSRIRPAPRPGADNDFIESDKDDSEKDDADEGDADEERHSFPDSSQIRAATAGRMSSRCVYSSSCVANQSVSRKGRHATITEIAHRKRNAAFGARLIIASRWFGQTHTGPHVKLSASYSMRRKNRLPQRAVARGQWPGAECRVTCLPLRSDF